MDTFFPNLMVVTIAFTHAFCLIYTLWIIKIGLVLKMHSQDYV